MWPSLVKPVSPNLAHQTLRQLSGALRLVADRPMTLAETIQAKILTDALPDKKFVRTWYGRGEGHPCSACALPVTTNQIEVEGDLVETRGAYRFHNDCFDLWRAAIDSH